MTAPTPAGHVELTLDGAVPAPDVPDGMRWMPPTIVAAYEAQHAARARQTAAGAPA